MQFLKNAKFSLLRNKYIMKLDDSIQLLSSTWEAETRGLGVFKKTNIHLCFYMFYHVIYTVIDVGYGTPIFDIWH